MKGYFTPCIDRIGNGPCIPDLNNDMITNWLDLMEMVPCFRRTIDRNDTICDDADLNGNGRVGRTDVWILLEYWNRPPGPAGALP